jgi:hypothetical protein
MRGAIAGLVPGVTFLKRERFSELTFTGSKKISRMPERSAIVASLTQAVAEARNALRSTSGQTVLRRLNKREYLQTVGDLFALDMRLFDPTTKFPRDQMAEHLDNLGDVLQTSGYLLAQYLDAADQVVDAIALEVAAAQEAPELVAA